MLRLAASLTLAAVALAALPPRARGQAPDSAPAFGQVRPAEVRAATERVYRSAAHPSHVTLPVLAE